MDGPGDAHDAETCAMDGPADAHDARICLGAGQLMLMMLALAGDLRKGRPSFMMLAFVWELAS